MADFHEFVIAAHECATNKRAPSFEREIKLAAKEFRSHKLAYQKVQDRINKLLTLAHYWHNHWSTRDDAPRLWTRVNRLLVWRGSAHFPSRRPK